RWSDVNEQERVWKGCGQRVFVLETFCFQASRLSVCRWGCSGLGLGNLELVCLPRERWWIVDGFCCQRVTASQGEGSIDRGRFDPNGVAASGGSSSLTLALNPQAGGCTARSVGNRGTDFIM
ncbi:unnamed protein product, partial [Pylaiella littoralis]